MPGSPAERAGHLVSLTASAQDYLGLFQGYNTNTSLVKQLLTLSCNTSALTLHQLFLWPCYCSPKRLQIPEEFWLCSVTPANGHRWSQVFAKSCLTVAHTSSFCTLKMQ